MPRPPLLALPLLVLLGCGTPDPAPEKPTNPCAAYALDNTEGARVFAVQPRVALEHFESYATYRAHLAGIVDTKIKPCLAKDKPNVIVFPEDTGLPAAFLGSRGQLARETSKSAFAAVLFISSEYQKPIDHYKALWPDSPLPEGILLGLTDTLWRAFHETNREIAASTGAFVVSSTNVAGKIEKSEDPAEIAALADPDLPSPSYVYAAREPAVYNTAFVYGPDGEIVASRKKPYLIELEETDLALTYGALREVEPVDLGFARLALLTSKDAWMPDMVDRLAAQGADVFVQPEAFSGWTVGESANESAWSPDTLSQSAPAAVRKHAAYRYGVVPHLVGNLFDLVFDGQSVIVGDAVPGELRTAYVGQEPAGGVLAVAPWVMEDPGWKQPELSLSSRRATLREAGQELLPGAARDNAYLETVIAADIDAQSPFPEAAAGSPGALGPSAEIGGGGAPQGHPALAWSSGGPLVAAFEEGAPGQTRIRVALSTDAGKSFGPPSPVTSGTRPQIMPALLVTGTNIYVCWVERDDQGAQVACALSSDGGKTFGTPILLPALGGGAPDAWAPSFAAAGGRVFVAYVDASSGTERILVASAAEGTTVFDAIDVGGPKAFPDPNIRNNQWSPAIAAIGSDVAVGWVDFRGYGWDVYIARSNDLGKTFGLPARADDGTDAPERLHDDPSLLFVEGGGASTLAVGWSDVRLRQSPSKARVTTSAGSVFGPSRVLGGAPEAASAWSPRLVSIGPGKLAAVWQDDRTLASDIYLAASSDGGGSFGGEMRIDDGGDGPSYQTAPAAAGDGSGRVAIAWEDSRSGRTRIRWVVGTP
ncbi:hypothetical protein [Polyangium aurulentum]|uniref:hypothetical protein n=1 Tax=Polyangium aurulentum TaxID=2567896 RepID=UPI0010ADEF96|nr:hypothetical protein [Polyangium aurulentum]UQA61850.1 hypothetical protein E8A73_015805 [Polyangium aurulentum]